LWNIRQNGGDQALRRKRLSDAAQAIEEAPQLFVLRARRGVAVQPALELPGLRGSRLAVEDDIHQFNELGLAHVL
jgi:hypothetical protein